MCTTCGCSDTASPTITNLEDGSTVPVHNHSQSEHHHHHHDHEHGEGHDHVHHHSHNDAQHPHTHTHHGETVSLNEAILAKNDLIAERNRGWFEGREILALNLVSSPGAGKTSLLVQTIDALRDSIEISVVEGDQETANDAARIRETGCSVIQVNTGTGCHLEADMLQRGLSILKPPMRSVVMIENVGNLVCPALFDLGEHSKVAVLSVTEGDDKPLKYPHMFRAASLLLINKIDLLPYVDFDVAKCIRHAREINPSIEALEVSVKSGEGMSQWYQWIKNTMPYSESVPGINTKQG